MRYWHNIPLVLFTLVMPGIVIGYSLNYEGGGRFLLSIIVLSIITLGFAGLHLGQPAAAPMALQHIRRSWLSREMLFFTLFLSGLCLQWLFQSLRNPLWAVAIILLGLAGTVATIMVYRRIPRMGRWPIWSDFLLEAWFIGILLGKNGNVSAVTVAIILKSVKDIVVSMQLIRRDGNHIWILPVLNAAFFAILTVTLKTLWPVPLAVLNSVIFRVTFFTRIDQPTLAQTAAELRKHYLPAEYQKYFSIRKTDQN